MEIKEIDGKKFIEYNEHKQQRKKFIVSIIFLILMIIAITALINATTTLIKNKDIIQSDPLIFGMDVHGFISCQCFDMKGKSWISNGTGFLHQAFGEGWVNYTNYFNATKFEGVLNGSGGSS